MWAEQKTERRELKIGWSGAWSWRGRKWWSGAQSGRWRSQNGAGSRLNWPLTAGSNLTFRWLCNVYSPHSTVCSLLFQFSLFYSSCTRLVTCFNPVQPFTCNPAQACVLNKTQSISSTWRVLAQCAVWTTSKNKKLIRRWNSERELSVRRHRTRDTKYKDSCINSATARRGGYVLERMFTKFIEITQCNGHYAVQGHSRSPILAPIESSYTTSY